MSEKTPKSNLPSNLIPNEKALDARIDKAERRIERSSKTFIDDCIFLGEELTEVQKIVGFGQWGSYLNRKCHFRFATSKMASIYIRIAQNKVYIKAHLSKSTSINGLIEGLKLATPEQIEEARQLELAEAEAKAQAQAAKAIPAPQPAPKPEPEIIDGEFTEIKAVPKPAPEPEPEEEDQTEALLEEYESRVQHLIKDNARLETILNDDDQLAAALLELKKVNAAYKNLQEHLAGVQNQLNANIKLAGYWKKEHDKLKKAMEAA
jgi:exonuclease VII small subunit